MSTTRPVIRVTAAAVAMAMLLLRAQPAAVTPAPAPLTLQVPLRDKNFFAPSLLAGNDEIRRLKLAKDPGAPWTDEQMQSIATQLTGLYRSSAAVRALVSGPLRRSGVL